MAPTRFESTNAALCSPSNFTITHGTHGTHGTHKPYNVYYKTRTSYESYEYSGTTDTMIYWSNQDKYEATFSYTLIYPNKEIEINIKKLLKKMNDVLCKEGWIKHVSYYTEPKLEPISLRGVRLDGRGWANNI